MNLKALRRPAHTRRPTTQLFQSRRWRRDLERARSAALGHGQLIGRWTTGEDGRLVCDWSFERPALFPVNRKRGSDA